MRVNAKRVMDLRKRQAWSQDELAVAAGLNLRTVQRVENAGTASLQSLKAIASALETDVESLKQRTEMQFEYKTLVLPFRVGVFKQGLPDIQSALSKEGRQGWQFRQMVLPSTHWGQSDTMVAILERAVEREP